MSDKYKMDDHKLHWHLDRVNDFVQGKRTVPLHIDMGITTGCNMSCTYCYGALQGNTDMGKRTDMSSKTLVRLIKDAKEIGVRSIALIGEGENTINPALWDGFRAAKEVDMSLCLATNGLLIKENEIFDMLSSLTWIRINISAATEASYLKIHGVNQFKKAIENISKIVAVKKEKGLDTVIGLQMVVTKENMDQIIPLSELGKELGVDYTVIKPCSDTSDKVLDSPDEEYLSIEPILKEAESFSDDNYAVVIKWHKLKNLGHKDYDVCYGTNFIIAISGNGNVFPCGHWFNIRSDEFLFGNINDQSFKEIVFSDRWQEVQENIQKINVNKDCESNCRQHYINRYLSMIKNPPEHVNFI